MFRLIKEYQKQYIEILKEFKDKNNRDLKEYYLIFDKLELLYKRNKKTIFNYLEIEKGFAYYGGATYFNKNRGEIYPILISEKKLIVADPILKLSIFLRNPDVFKEDRIKEIIDRAIKKTLDIQEEFKEGYIIYINPDEYLKDIKEDITNTAEELTLQYLNHNLNIKCRMIKELIFKYKDFNYELLDKEFPKLNNLVATVDAEEGDTLRQKVYKNFYYSGIEEEQIQSKTDIQKIIITLIGLFGQAFELKTISLLLNIPLYITRANVLMYVNFINRINEEDSSNMLETNILFAIYIFFRDYEFNKGYLDIVEYSNANNMYIEILEECKKFKFSMEGYLEKIEKIIERDNGMEKPFVKKQHS